MFNVSSICVIDLIDIKTRS